MVWTTWLAALVMVCTSAHGQDVELAAAKKKKVRRNELVVRMNPNTGVVQFQKLNGKWTRSLKAAKKSRQRQSNEMDSNNLLQKASYGYGYPDPAYGYYDPGYGYYDPGYGYYPPDYGYPNPSYGGYYPPYGYDYDCNSYYYSGNYYDPYAYSYQSRSSYFFYTPTQTLYYGNRGIRPYRAYGRGGYNYYRYRW